MRAKVESSKLKFVLRPTNFLIFFLLTLGIFARFALVSRGYNDDFKHYQWVIDATRQGFTAWQTDKYNYGPIWWYLLKMADWTHLHTGISVRYSIVGILTFADLFIAYFIYKFKGSFLGTLFFVNPISIIISGYHNQFDNLSIAFVCLAILKAINVDNKPITTNDFIVVSLLGASLTTKHIFIFFIIWIAIRQKTLVRKLLYAIGPFLVFVLSFAPFLASSWVSIKLNVIDYRSTNNAPFFQTIEILTGFSVGTQFATVFFVSILLIIGLVLREIAIDHLLFIYCIVVVAFSPALANQYLAIAAFGAIGLFNIGFALYFFYATYWLTISPEGLHITQKSQWIGSVLFNEPGLHNLVKYQYEPFPILLLSGLLISKQLVKNRLKVEQRTRNA